MFINITINGKVSSIFFYEKPFDIRGFPRIAYPDI